MNRKTFLSNMIGTVALLSMPNTIEALARKKKYPIGIQLWSAKEDMAKDPMNTLIEISKMSYQYVESFDGEKGMFWGHKPQEFKQLLKDLNLKILSSHVDITKDFEKKAEAAREAGIKYLICPAIGVQKNLDGYKKAAEQFNRCGEICTKNGIRFGYHNHSYSFTLQEGQYPQDIMMKETDPNLVDFEMDIYWVIVAGQNPIEWINKHPHRFKLCHVKDREHDATDNFASCILGNGTIDYPSILSQLKEKDVKHFIVEQEKFAEGSRLMCIEKDGQVLQRWL